jgi:hypothetical protein
MAGQDKEANMEGERLENRRTVVGSRSQFEDLVGLELRIATSRQYKVDSML